MKQNLIWALSLIPMAVGQERRFLMPCQDGTGPRGRGPMTGHGAGQCVLRESKARPGYWEGVLGRQARFGGIHVQAGRFLGRGLYYLRRRLR